MLKCIMCGKEREGGDVEMCTCGNWMFLKPSEKKETKRVEKEKEAEDERFS